MAGLSRSPDTGERSGAAVAIQVRGLVKSYGPVEAVRGVDLAVRQGEVFALLGPNGAGKTTVVEILEGYCRRDAGCVSVLGFDPGRQRREIKARIGIVLQATGVDPYLTVAETIAMYSGYYPHPRPAEEIIGLVGLDAKANARVLKLSGGQQRRLDIAIALAGDPDLLFLDEPTTGFDPSGRRETWEVVKNLAGLGKTVLLTTHYMDEAEYLADRVAIISGGRIVAEGTPATLGERDRSVARVRFRLPGSVALPGELGATSTRDGLAEIATGDLTRVLHDLTGWAIDRRVSLDGLEIVRPSLEDIYLGLTGSPTESPATQSTKQPRRKR
ncbi:MAG: ABC transporter ATP-binding protein [Candidatus Dormibacteria bacterium]